MAATRRIRGRMCRIRWDGRFPIAAEKRAREKAAKSDFGEPPWGQTSRSTREGSWIFLIPNLPGQTATSADGRRVLYNINALELPRTR